jgi:hypothetical protein
MFILTKLSVDCQSACTGMSEGTTAADVALKSVTSSPTNIWTDYNTRHKTTASHSAQVQYNYKPRSNSPKKC